MYGFGALNVPYSLYYVDNDMFTGTVTAHEVIAELGAKNYRFIDGDRLSHSDAVVGIDTRCYTIDPIMLKFEQLEDERDDDHKNYRSAVRRFVNSLPLKKGCEGKEF